MAVKSRHVFLLYLSISLLDPGGGCLLTCSMVGCSVEGSSDRYCTGVMFHPKLVSLAQVVPGPIQL